MEETLKRSRHRLEDNIIMDDREMGWEGMDWIHKYIDTVHGSITLQCQQ